MKAAFSQPAICLELKRHKIENALCWFLRLLILAIILYPLFIAPGLLLFFHQGIGNLACIWMHLLFFFVLLFYISLIISGYYQRKIDRLYEN